MKTPRGFKRGLLLLLLTAGPAWLLATESGLRFALACAESLSGGLVSVREAHGSLAGDVSLRGLEIRTPASTVNIEQADFNLRLTRLWLARVQAEWLKVRALTVRVHGRPPGAGERRPLTVTAPLGLAVEDGELKGFRLVLASGREWSLPEARFRARWRGRWIVLGHLRALTREAGEVALHGRIAIADDRLEFEEFEITQPSAVQVNGAMALTLEARNSLWVAWQQLRWPKPEVLPWLASPRGSLKVDGPWPQYGWTVGANTLALDMAGELSAQGHGDLGSLAIEQARIKALAGVVTAQGRVDWSPHLGTELALRWENLDPSVRFKEWPGRLKGGVTLHARWPQGKPQLEFDGGFDDSQLRGYAFALRTRGHTEDGRITLQQFALRSGTSDLNARGALWPQADLTGDVRSTDFRSLWTGLSGSGAARFSVRGAPESMRFGLHANAQNVGYGKLRAQTLAADANVGFKGHSEATLKLGHVEAGVALDELVLSGDGTRERHRAQLSVRGAEGVAVLGFTGGERRRVWSGQLAQATLTPAGGEPWSLEEEAALRVSAGGLRLEPACFRSTGSRACVDLDLVARDQRIAFRLRDFDLHHLKAWMPPQWAVRGTLGGTAAMQIAGGELAAFTADLEGSAGAIEGDGVRMDFGPAHLRVEPEDGRLAATLHLAPAGGAIDGEVWISPGGPLLDRPMLGELKVKLPDLAWLPVLSPEIAAAQGSIDADLNVSGTLRGPALDGRLQVAGGRVKLATPGIELTDITASFDRGRAAPLKARVSAKSGQGQFTLEGVLKSMQPKLAGTFTLKGEEVQGFNTPELHAWITPDLTLALDGRSAKLTGTVTVPRAEITPRQLEAGGVAPSSDQVLVSRDDSEVHSAMLIETDVRIVLGDKVRFDGLGLKTRLEGAIAAHDEPGRPTTGRGELHLVGGRYKAYGQDLQIETGRLLFNGGRITDPAIDLSAYRKPVEDLNDPRHDVKVGLRARGTLEAPQFSLYSEPAMTQEEQLSWLVLGRSLDTTLKSQQSTQVSGAAASLGLTGGDLLAQQLAPRLGFDEVSVGAKPGETADLARLTIGKYLSPKLFVSYGVGLFQPGHFFRMQYSLSKRFKLIGESGATQGGDVLYTVESGPRKKPSAPPPQTPPPTQPPAP